MALGIPTSSITGLKSYTDAILKKKLPPTGPTAPTPTTINPQPANINVSSQPPIPKQDFSVLDHLATSAPGADIVKPVMTQDQMLAAAAASAGRAAAGASSAASQAGQAQQQAQGTAMANASSAAGAAAAPKIDPISGLPVMPAGTQPTNINVGTVPVMKTVQPLSQADQNAAAAAASAGRAAASASSAASKAGEEQQKAQAAVMANAANTASTPAAVKPTAPVAPVAPPTPSKADGIYESVLEQLAAGIKDNKPLAGTAAQIQQNREALATYAKSAEARAGATAAKTGALGQGTANVAGQAVRSDILGELAKSELGNTQLVSNEKQKLIESATRAGEFAKNQSMDQQRIDVQKDQFGQNKEMEQQRIDVQKDQFGQNLATNKEQFSANLQENKAQFAATLDQRKTEFAKTFGAQEAQAYNNQLERLAQDNPVLATKLTNHLLSGKTGAVGSFTPEEIQQMKDYTSKKQAQDDKLTDVMNKILESVPGQIESSTKATKEADEAAQKTKDLQTAKEALTSGGSLTPAQETMLKASGDIPSYKISQGELTGSTASGLVGKKVAIDGVVYSIESVGSEKKQFGGYNDYSVVKDSQGNIKYLWQGSFHDAKPRGKD